MADVTCTISEATAYLHARAVMIAREREFPFPAQYVMDKLDKKIPSEVAAYEKARIGFCEQFSEKDAEGKPVMVNGNFTFSAEGVEALNAAVAPLLAETITLTNVRKLKPDELGTVALTKAETSGLAPFLEE